MPNQFHILHGYASYQRDDVTGTETIPSACGVTLVHNRDDYCNISIANPDWNHNWCHDCVRMFP